MPATRLSRRRLAHGLIVLAGVFVFQGLLYGPSLMGAKLLLPLDLLAQPGLYLPVEPPPPPSNYICGDAVTHWELARRFAAAEVRAGRIPLWDPFSYAGAPFADFGKFSPFNLVRYVFVSPVAVAWVQVLKAFVAGGGAFLFLRRVLGLRFWPAALMAWLHPVSSFFILWQHDPISDVAAWYPALLVAVHQTIRRPSGWGMMAVAVLTCVTMLSGHVDVAGQVLLGSGLFAVWSLLRRNGRRLSRPMVRSALAVAGGWVLGLLLSAPYVLPLIFYTRTSQRLALRQSGAEERPPGSLNNLPQAAFAQWFGTHRPNSVYFALSSSNLPESAAGASVGVLALLVAAPLAWTDRRRWGINGFLLVSAGIGLLWVMGIPGAVALLRLPGLNLMSHNRLTFVTAFSVLALAATGINNSWPNGVPRRWWFLLPLALLLILGAAALDHAFALPPQLSQMLQETADRNLIQRNVRDSYLGCAAFCLAGVVSWGILASRFGRWAVWLLVVLIASEFIFFAYGYNPQCDPALYYPPLSALQAINRAEPGRTLCVDCLPANFPLAQGIRDIRGYDAIDPRPILDILDRARDPRDHCPLFARTQTYLPKTSSSPEGDLRLSPLLDMLNVRYVVFRKRLSLKQHPLWSEQGYFVYANKRALDRVYVPLQVRSVEPEQALLDILSNAEFDPRQTAYISVQRSLPLECRGTARITAETPCRITVEAKMATAGLLVLADQWADGWSAEMDGQPAELLRVNHALKGVVLPAGTHEIVFMYRPPGLMLGLGCCGFAVAVLLLRSYFIIYLRSV